TVVRMMAVMGVVRIVARCTSGRIPIRQREQRRGGGRICASRDSGLCPAYAKARVGDLGRRAVREHRRKGNSKRYKNRLLLHDADHMGTDEYLSSARIRQDGEDLGLKAEGADALATAPTTIPSD